jgi:hypothetical protein
LGIVCGVQKAKPPEGGSRGFAERALSLPGYQPARTRKEENVPERTDPERSGVLELTEISAGRGSPKAPLLGL